MAIGIDVYPSDHKDGNMGARGGPCTAHHSTDFFHDGDGECRLYCKVKTA